MCRLATFARPSGLGRLARCDVKITALAAAHPGYELHWLLAVRPV